MAPLTLQIGEHRFTTTESTLREGSTYFESLFSGSWQEAEKEADGSLFIDRDGGIFAYILGFLRSGKYPFFYDDAGGEFDHDKYVSLLVEAEYFGIDKLPEWIRERGYEKVVEVRRLGSLGVGMDGLSDINGSIKTGDKYEYFPEWETRKVYVCPRNVDEHRGKPGFCGRQCRKALGDEEPEYVDERELMMVEIRTYKTFNMALLTA